MWEEYVFLPKISTAEQLMPFAHRSNATVAVCSPRPARLAEHLQATVKRLKKAWHPPRRLRRKLVLLPEGPDAQ